MATQTVSWLPSTAPNIVGYRLLSSDEGPSGPFVQLVEFIPNVQMGTYWDATTGCFFYEDVEISYRLYRLNTLDSQGNVFGDPGAAPFGPNNDPQRAPVPNIWPINQDTGGAGFLRYVTPDGVPVPGTTVRVYKKADWDARRFNVVIGLTRTDAVGDWVTPIFVEPGNSFVVQYELPNVWGPDTLEITV